MKDEINWGPSGELVYKRTYSRIKPDGSSETWPETVERVVDGNLALVDERYQQPDERELLIQMMTEFKLLPAGRHLWASGVKNAQHLFNCFSGDTLVHTEQGVFTISSLAGETHNVLSEGGQYRPARFDSYGEQQLWCVELSSGEEFLATEDHSWVTFNSGETYRHPTSKLAGKRVPYNLPPAPEMGDRYWEGVAHGIVYGDGSTSGEISTMVHLFGEKRELTKYLSGYSRGKVREHGDRTYIGTMPDHWKQLPGGEVNREYARGFIVGLIASDGYAKNGTAQINTSVDVGAIHRLIISAGLVPGKISVDREDSPFDGSYKPSYRIGIRGWSLDPERDLLRTLHRSRFGETRKSQGPRTVKVNGVRPTDYVEQVYCAVEPETHTITIGSGILTGQCWVSGWTEKPSDHFEFTFMRLMEGGGVGANYSNRFLSDYPPVQQELYVHIVCDPDHPDYQAMKDAGVLSTEYDPNWMGAFEIEDSREGWASALVDLIDTHYRDDVAHFQRVYDVSRVRPLGAKLKTFGGTASGPLPLSRMLIDVCEILSNRAAGWDGNRPGHDFWLSGIDAMEIDHAIAQCVVAGGVRRSARMAMIHWQDPQIEEFVRCKAETGSHWTTNISVEVDAEFWRLAKEGYGSFAVDRVDMPRQKHAHRVLGWISEGMVNNGEPGFWDSSLSNEGEPNEVVCTNPCISPDAVIETVNGPVRIADITEPTMVYTKQPDGTLGVRKASAAFMTKRNAETLRIGLTNGDELVVTPDHRVMRRSGEYARADELKVHDALETICRARRGWRYSGVKLSSEHNRAYRMEHRMVYEGVHGTIPTGFDIDHINGDHHDNRVDNLRALSHSEHASWSISNRPNDHQVKDERNQRYARSGNNGKKLLKDAIKPPRSTNWGRTPRVAYIEPGPVEDVYDITVDETHNFIADGVVVHNCGEITLQPWEPCNLGHINLAAFVRDNGKVDQLGLLTAHRLMTRFLIRATFSPVADPKSREVLDRNRRIGVGHLGVASFLAMAHHRFSRAPATPWFQEKLRWLADTVDKEAGTFCHQLRIPVPVKSRTVAPTGTIAKMPGVSEGIHPIFARYFKRRIRFSKTDPALAGLIADGYSTEPCQYDQSGNTVVVEFPTKDTLVQSVVDIHGPEAEDIVEAADDLTLNELLAFQALYQACWADNAVSFTANVDPADVKAGNVAELLVKFSGMLKGATIFPEASMPQAPYERITKAEYEAAADTQSVADSVDEECANGACPIR